MTAIAVPERHAELSDCIRLALREARPDSRFQALLRDYMSGPGRVLAGGDPLWPRLVQDTCGAIGGDRGAAVWPAAAVEFAVAAIDVADDLADGDISDEVELHRAPAAAIALSSLAHFCVSQSAEFIGLPAAHRIASLLSTGCLASCSGQDLDILLEQEPWAAEDDALHTSWRKSGSLAAMACAVGAACASPRWDVIEAAGRFGAHIGMVAQLVNDIVDISDGEGSLDIARRKKTLPVAYSLTCAREEGIYSILGWYGRTASCRVRGREVAEAIRNLGGLHFAWAVAGVHRQRAIEAAHALQSLAPGCRTSILLRLVPELDPG